MKKGDKIKLNQPTLLEDIWRVGILTITLVGAEEVWFDGCGFKTKLSIVKVNWLLENGYIDVI